jgi:hypothetical protein
LVADPVAYSGHDCWVVDELVEHRSEQMLGPDWPPDVEPGVGSLAQQDRVTRCREVQR